MSENNKQQELLHALVEAQRKICKITKNEDNPFFKSKYAPLDRILEAIKPVLNENKLFLTQILKTEADKDWIETRIYHENGEYLSCIVPLKIKKEWESDPQKYGSAITYMRRYSLGPLLAISETEDDDGNKASNNNTTKKLAKIVEEDQAEIFEKANSDLAKKLQDEIYQCSTLAELAHFKEQNKKELNKLKKYAPDLFEGIKTEFENYEAEIMS